MQKQSRFVGFIFNHFQKIIHQSVLIESVIGKINKIQGKKKGIAKPINPENYFLIQRVGCFFPRDDRHQNKNHIGVNNGDIVKTQAVIAQFRQLGDRFYLNQVVVEINKQ